MWEVFNPWIYLPDLVLFWGYPKAIPCRRYCLFRLGKRGLHVEIFRKIEHSSARQA